MKFSEDPVPTALIILSTLCISPRPSCRLIHTQGVRVSHHLQCQTDQGKEEWLILFTAYFFIQTISFCCCFQIAACELLHALVLFIIGKSAQPALQKKVDMFKHGCICCPLLHVVSLLIVVVVVVVVVVVYCRVP